MLTKKWRTVILINAKIAQKKDTREHRYGKGREKVLAYDIERSKHPLRKQDQLLRSRLYAKNNPKVKKAQRLLRFAVISGEIVTLPCFECGAKAEAHHPDYDRPLDVIWLCSSHHKQAHALV